MFKICTILGTRPEIIRLSRIIDKFDKNFNHILINTNQNFTYELNEVFFKSLNIRKPDYEFNNKSKHSVLKIGEMLSQSFEILSKEKPDAVFILGDTDSSLCSIVAKKLNIILFHFEAGNRCFDNIVPEEINRKIIDSISDLNFTYSEFARENLLNEGQHVNNVICIGSPMKEILKHYWSDILNSKITDKLNLKKNEFTLFSLHRQETVNNKSKLEVTLNNIIKFSDLMGGKIIWPIHPRTLDKINTFGLKLPNSISTIRPLNFIDYVNLQINSILTISDSGTLSEEASLLGLSALNLREQFERQEILGNEKIPLIGFNEQSWKVSINVVLNNKRKMSPRSPLPSYNKDNVSDLILSNVISYLVKIKNL